MQDGGAAVHWWREAEVVQVDGPRPMELQMICIPRCNVKVPNRIFWFVIQFNIDCMEVRQLGNIAV